MVRESLDDEAEERNPYPMGKAGRSCVKLVLGEAPVLQIPVNVLILPEEDWIIRGAPQLSHPRISWCLLLACVWYTTIVESRLQNKVDPRHGRSTVSSHGGRRHTVLSLARNVLERAFHASKASENEHGLMINAYGAGHVCDALLPPFPMANP